MTSNYNYREPAWVQKQITADRGGRLSTKDRIATNRLKQGVELSLLEQMSNVATELDPSTLRSLDDAIRSAKDPEIIKILLDERSNVMNLLGEAETLRAQGARPSVRDPNVMDQITDFVQSIFK